MRKNRREHFALFIYIYICTYMYIYVRMNRSPFKHFLIECQIQTITWFMSLVTFGKRSAAKDFFCWFLTHGLKRCPTRRGYKSSALGKTHSFARSSGFEILFSCGISQAQRAMQHLCSPCHENVSIL